MAAAIATTVSSTSSETAPLSGAGATEYVVVDGSYFQKVNDAKVKINPPSDKKKVSEKAEDKDRNSPPSAEATVPMKMLRQMKTQMRGRSNRPIRVTLVGQYTGAFQSAASSQLFGTTALTPIGVQDWSSFGAVYDLCRVKSVGFNVMFSASGATPSATTAWWAVAWDPMNPAGYGTSVDLLTALNHLGPVAVLPQFVAGNTTGAMATQSVTPTGFHSMNVKLPVQGSIVNDQTSPIVGGGSWFATSSTTFVAGYLKSYQPACGTGVVTQLTVLVKYHCEFKNRT